MAESDSTLSDDLGTTRRVGGLDTRSWVSRRMEPSLSFFRTNRNLSNLDTICIVFQEIRKGSGQFVKMKYLYQFHRVQIQFELLPSNPILAKSLSFSFFTSNRNNG